MLSAARERKMVVVQFDYVANSPSELSLEAGDIIELMEKRSDGWWRGRCREKEGLFPSSFVVELDPDEDTNLRALIDATKGQSSAGAMKHFIYVVCPLYILLLLIMERFYFMALFIVFCFYNFSNNVSMLVCYLLNHPLPLSERTLS